jgi:hypothetical protein
MYLVLLKRPSDSTANCERQLSQRVTPTALGWTCNLLQAPIYVYDPSARPSRGLIPLTTSPLSTGPIQLTKPSVLTSPRYVTSETTPGPTSFSLTRYPNSRITPTSSLSLQELKGIAEGLEPGFPDGSLISKLLPVRPIMAAGQFQLCVYKAKRPSPADIPLTLGRLLQLPNLGLA